MYRAQALVSASNFSAAMLEWIERLGREPQASTNSAPWRGAATRPASA